MNKIIAASALVLIILGPGALLADQQESPATTSRDFFAQLDTNQDGHITFAEAPEQGKMLVEFLLSRAGKQKDDRLSRQDFLRVTSLPGTDSDHRAIDQQAVAAALDNGTVQQAPENCPACAMGLTAEFVFQRLDVNEDKLDELGDLHQRRLSDPKTMKERLQTGDVPGPLQKNRRDGSGDGSGDSDAKTKP